MLALLADHVALVTGGARGIGRAIVDTFAQHGARGIVLDTSAALDGVSLPSSFSGRVADVTNESEISAAVQHSVSSFGRLDVVVANAGIVPPWRETDGLDFEEWDRVFAVNSRGVAATIKHAVPAMMKDGGSIIATASINILEPHGRQLAYTSSKHSVMGIVQCAALDLGRYNIRVNALAPGPVATTAMKERLRFRAEQAGRTEEQALQELAAQSPLNRIATESEIGKAALFLASDLSSGITGLLLPVDTGLNVG
ncbi:MAG: SDR family oxidoreductase [Rhizobiaceae bacterium]|nr:SDR family oxidoreductase [Rhizobiaceae bacterium]